MATEKLLINGHDSGWPTGATTDVDEGIASADAAVMSTTVDDDVIIFDLTDSAIGDGDTVTAVTITIRGRSTGAGGKDSFGVDLLIGGVAQGAGVVTANLTSSHANYGPLSEGAGAWDSDWTAAQLDGMQVQVRANQTGKGAAATWEIDTLDVDITYTPGGLTEDPLLGELDLAGIIPTVVIANNVAPDTDALALAGQTPSRAEIIIEPPTGAINIWKYVGLKLQGIPPTIEVSSGAITREPTLGSLTIDEKTPTRVVNDIPVPSEDTLAFTGYAPTAVVGEVELPTADTLTLSGLAPTVSVAHLATPDNDTLVIDEKTPVRTVGDLREPAIDALVINEQTPVIVHDRLSDVPEDTLALSGSVPLVSVNNVVQPSTDALTIDEKQANRVVGDIRTPAIDELAFTGYAPTTGAAGTAEPTLETLALSGAIPTAVVGNVVAPGTDALVLSGKVPTTGATKTALPTIDALALSGAAPTTVVANNIPVGLGTLTLSGKTPDIPSEGTIEIPTGGINIYKYIGLKLDGFPPTVSFAETVTPSVGSLTLSGKIPTLNITITPTVGSLSLSGAVPTLAGTVSPDTGTLTLQGYATLDQDTVVPTVGSLSLSGQTPSLKGIASPATAALTLTGQSLTVDYAQSPATSVGALTLAGGTPAAVVATGPTPSTAALTFNADPPQTAETGGVITLKGNLSLSGSAPAATIKSFPTVGSDSLSISGQTPIRDVGQIVIPGSGELVLFSTVAVVEPTVGSVSLEGQAVSLFYREGTFIENANATTAIPSNYEQCDFSGFRQLPGSLKLTWNKHAVRKKSWEERHPQDTLQSVPERQKGSKRPEQDDTFIDTLYPDGVDPDDL